MFFLVFVHPSVNTDRSERLVYLLDGLALSQLLIPSVTARVEIGLEMEGRMGKCTSCERLDPELTNSCLNGRLSTVKTI